MSSADWLALRDPGYVAKLIALVRPAVKGYFRSEVHGVENIPHGGALLISNHSGGLVPMDVPVLAVACHDHFGSDWPFYVLAHDGLLMGGGKQVLGRAGFIPASRENALAALRSGAATVLFPGGDYDVFRPTSEANKIDFDGRKGYVRLALEAGMPIVPVVSIGGQEEFLVLTRGERLARLLRMDKLLRLNVAPIVVGFPFGLTSGYMPNLPFPAKIVTRVLPPIDLTARRSRSDGRAETDLIDEIDRNVRANMQAALDDLAERRRFPIIG